MIMYRTYSDIPVIKALEVVKETDKQIVFINEFGNEKREAKKSDAQNWHKTWKDAQDFLWELKREHRTKLQKIIERIDSDIEKLLLMKDPTEQENNHE